MTKPSLVDCEVRDDGVAVVTLNNPPLNLTRVQSIDRMLSIFAALRTDRSVRALVLVGAGSRAFCAGSDIEEFLDVRHDVVSAKLARENEAFTALAELPIPTIAAVNAHALGGGAELAIACDLRVMDAAATIGFPEVKLGVFAGSGGLFRLPRLIGHGRALELLYTGDRLDAATALRIGLVERIAPQGRALEDGLSLASELARGPAAALAAMSAGVRASFTQDTSRAVAQSLRESATVFEHPDVDAGVAAFRARQRAEFARERDITR